MKDTYFLSEDDHGGGIATQAHFIYPVQSFLVNYLLLKTLGLETLVRFES